MVAKFQGRRVNGTAVPLFGSRQYDKALNSAGMRSTRAELGDGLAKLDCAVTYEPSNRTPAMATISDSALVSAIGTTVADHGFHPRLDSFQ